LGGLTGLTATTSTAFSQPVVEIPEIVINANQAPTEASRVGSSATVLMGETMRSKGYSTVADALRTVPGMSISQSGGPGTLTQARIRGSESNHVLVLIDDVPVNDFANGDFNFADFALEDVERIEVIRGPQSGIYGANAHSGVISIVTRTGRGLARPQADLRIEGGSQQTAKASGSVRGAAGPLYGAFSFAHNTTDGFNLSRFGSERDGSHATTTTAKVGIELTPTANIEATFRRAARFTQFDSQPFFGPYEGLTFDSAYDFNRAENILGRIAATWSLFDGALVQKLSASRYEERRNDDDVTNGFFRSKVKSIPGTAWLFRSSSNSWTLSKMLAASTPLCRCPACPCRLSAMAAAASHRLCWALVWWKAWPCVISNWIFSINIFSEE
jgi:vitamin B12 transporter